MLNSFVGTYDHRGLLSLRLETADTPTRVSNSFWAIIDENYINEIRNAVLNGDRDTALLIIRLRAESMGQLTT